jgi:hypothetical protein
LPENIGENLGGSLKRNTPVTVKVNGKEINTNAIVINTKILVPLKEVFESIGALVTINETNTSATVKYTDFSFEVVAGENKVTINAQNTTTLTLDHEVVAENNEIFVSIRLALTTLKAKLGRDAEHRIVKIDTLPDNGLTVSSPAFNTWGNILHKFVQKSVGGENINFPIEWKGAPTNTKSFAVVIYDPHLISEYYVHWAVVNIDGSISKLEENAALKLADGQQTKPYYGMEPPRFTGDHAYQIVVYALDTDKIEIPNQVVFFEDIASVLEPHAIDSGTLVSFFQS